MSSPLGQPIAWPLSRPPLHGHSLLSCWTQCEVAGGSWDNIQQWGLAAHICVGSPQWFTVYTQCSSSRWVVMFLPNPMSLIMALIMLQLLNWPRRLKNWSNILYPFKKRFPPRNPIKQQNKICSLFIPQLLHRRYIHAGFLLTCFE